MIKMYKPLRLRSGCAPIKQMNLSARLKSKLKSCSIYWRWNCLLIIMLFIGIMLLIFLLSSQNLSMYYQVFIYQNSRFYGIIYILEFKMGILKLNICSQSLSLNKNHNSTILAWNALLTCFSLYMKVHWA